MIHKWMQLTIDILTGRNKLIIIILLLFSACDLFQSDDYGDYSYKSYIVNNSTTKVKVVIGTINDNLKVDNELTPGEKIHYKGAPKVNKNDDVLKQHLFDDYSPNYDIVQIFVNDKIVKKWEGPAKDMGVGEHHFFNFNSWNVTFNENEYTLEFNITDTDLEQ